MPLWACSIAKHLTEETRDTQACLLPTLASWLAALVLHTAPFSVTANLMICFPQPSPAAPSQTTRPSWNGLGLTSKMLQPSEFKLAESTCLQAVEPRVWSCFSLFPTSPLSSDEYLQSEDLKYYLYVCDSQFHLSSISCSILSKATTYTIIGLVYQTDGT